jgi:hypothetical protein
MVPSFLRRGRTLVNCISEMRALYCNTKRSVLKTYLSHF